MGLDKALSAEEAPVAVVLGEIPVPMVKYYDHTFSIFDKWTNISMQFNGLKIKYIFGKPSEHKVWKR